VGEREDGTFDKGGEDQDQEEGLLVPSSQGLVSRTSAAPALEAGTS